MHLLIVLAITAILTMSFMPDVAPELERERVSATRDVFMHEVFVRTAESYVEKNPSASTTLTWAQIRHVAPPAYFTMTFPNTFTLRFSGSSTYICGESRGSTTHTQMSRNMPNYTVIPLNNNRYITSTNPAVANANRATCG